MAIKKVIVCDKCGLEVKKSCSEIDIGLIEVYISKEADQYDTCPYCAIVLLQEAIREIEKEK